MKKITEFTLLSGLGLPVAIKKQLEQHMVEPFDGNAGVTSDFWQEVGTSLILIEAGATDASLATEDTRTQELIQFVAEYPEFVELLDDDVSPYLLALSIITSDGGGCYVLAPMSSTTKPVMTLAENI
jgi:hypothetical protein